MQYSYAICIHHKFSLKELSFSVFLPVLFENPNIFFLVRMFVRQLSIFFALIVLSEFWFIIILILIILKFASTAKSKWYWSHTSTSNSNWSFEERRLNLANSGVNQKRNGKMVIGRTKYVLMYNEKSDSNLEKGKLKNFCRDFCFHISFRKKIKR